MGKRERVRKRAQKKEVSKKIAHKERGRRMPEKETEADDSSRSTVTPRKPHSGSYPPGAKILIVGDGDFSYTRGLARVLGSGKNMTASSYDAHSEVLKKYPQARAFLDLATRDGVKILHGVDARHLDKHFAGQHFNYVIFNFPHSGQQRVHVNRALLLDFFNSAKEFLLPNGEVHVTLKMHKPYTGWDVEAQAKTAGMVAGKHRSFDPPPGYQHHTTDPNAKTFQARSARTWIFTRGDGSARAAGAGDASAEAEAESEASEDLGGGLLFPTKKREIFDVHRAPKGYVPPVKKRGVNAMAEAAEDGGEDGSDGGSEDGGDGMEGEEGEDDGGMPFDEADDEEDSGDDLVLFKPQRPFGNVNMSRFGNDEGGSPPVASKSGKKRRHSISDDLPTAKRAKHDSPAPAASQRGVAFRTPEKGAASTSARRDVSHGPDDAPPTLGIRKGTPAKAVKPAVAKVATTGAAKTVVVKAAVAAAVPGVIAAREQKTSKPAAGLAKPVLKQASSGAVDAHAVTQLPKSGGAAKAKPRKQKAASGWEES